MQRVIQRLQISKTVLFICDIQEKFRPVIHRSETIISRSAFVNEFCKQLSIPRITTEHYIKAFGSTVSDISIRDHSETQPSYIFQKSKFSMMTEEVTNSFSLLNRNQVLLCGIEAHVCVLQTALDLLETGADVFVVCDAVSSQRPHDRAVALKRLEAAGCVLTTSESALFELMNTSEHPNFKALSALLKQYNKEPNDIANDLSP